MTRPTQTLWTPSYAQGIQHQTILEHVHLNNPEFIVLAHICKQESHHVVPTLRLLPVQVGTAQRRRIVQNWGFNLQQGLLDPEQITARHYIGGCCWLDLFELDKAVAVNFVVLGGVAGAVPSVPGVRDTSVDFAEPAAAVPKALAAQMGLARAPVVGAPPDRVRGPVLGAVGADAPVEGAALELTLPFAAVADTQTACVHLVAAIIHEADASVVMK
ncbi:hypothetical protein AaE_012616 [Aphanomyces astaci]|uniref:Uncharacterized protein n=1 Tax=Aphanomyces astaci TaxID=112090 RepID=A0A6A4ZMI6_APHAT|nr:hypothetical protein AaE_012616 [Aphanomyces astaci]